MKVKDLLVKFDIWKVNKTLLGGKEVSTLKQTIKLARRAGS